MFFKDIRVEVFWLSTHVKKVGPIGVYRLSKKVQKLFAKGVFHADIYDSFRFDGFVSALTHYGVNKSDGKVVFKPHETN